MTLKWDFDAVVREMQPGDSFFVPCTDWEPLRKQIHAAAKAADIKLHVRFVIEDELQGLRSWYLMP